MANNTKSESIRALCVRIANDSQFISSKLEESRAGGLSNIDGSTVSSIISTWNPLYSGQLDVSGYKEKDLIQINEMLHSIKRDKLAYLVLLLIFSRTESTIPIKDLGTAISRLRSSILVNDAITLTDRATGVVNEVLNMRLPSPVLRLDKFMGAGGRLADAIRDSYNPDRNISNVGDESLFADGATESSGILSWVFKGHDVAVNADKTMAIPKSLVTVPTAASDYIENTIHRASNTGDHIWVSGEKDGVYYGGGVNANTVHNMTIDVVNTSATTTAEWAMLGKFETMDRTYNVKMRAWTLRGSTNMSHVDVEIGFFDVSVAGQYRPLTLARGQAIIPGDRVNTQFDIETFDLTIQANSQIAIMFRWVSPIGAVAPLSFATVAGVPIPGAGVVAISVDEVCWDGGGRVAFTGRNVITQDKRLSDLQGEMDDIRTAFSTKDLGLLRMGFMYNSYLRQNWGVSISKVMLSIFKRQHKKVPNTGADWEVGVNFPDDSFWLSPVNYFRPTPNMIGNSLQQFLLLWNAERQKVHYRVWYQFNLSIADLHLGDGQFLDYLSEDELFATSI